MIVLCFSYCFQAPTLFTSMSSLFCVTCARNRFLQRGKLTDVIEDDGCKTCNLGNKKKKEKTFRLYLRWLAGGKGKLLELRANLRSTDKSQHWGPVQTVSDTKELFPSRQLYRTSIWNCELDEKHEKGRKHADSILYIFLLGLLQITYKLSWYSVHRSFSYKANCPLSGFSFGPILRTPCFVRARYHVT